MERALAEARGVQARERRDDAGGHVRPVRECDKVCVMLLRIIAVTKVPGATYVASLGSRPSWSLTESSK